MTVQELKEELECCPDDMEVTIKYTSSDYLNTEFALEISEIAYNEIILEDRKLKNLSRDYDNDIETKEVVILQ